MENASIVLVNIPEKLCNGHLSPTNPQNCIRVHYKNGTFKDYDDKFKATVDQWAEEHRRAKDLKEYKLARGDSHVLLPTESFRSLVSTNLRVHEHYNKRKASEPRQPSSAPLPPDLSVGFGFEVGPYVEATFTGCVPAEISNLKKTHNDVVTSLFGKSAACEVA